jgi:hypothetical protein
MTSTFRLMTALVAAISLFSTSASALSIRDFRKFSAPDQATYIMAAVSMLAYTYAANGDVAKGRCIQNWYFGQKGPSEIPARISAYESIDPDKYHVEGVIMGVTDKACGASQPQTAKQRP